MSALPPGELQDPLVPEAAAVLENLQVLHDHREIDELCFAPRPLRQTGKNLTKLGKHLLLGLYELPVGVIPGLREFERNRGRILGFEMPVKSSGLRADTCIPIGVTALAFSLRAHVTGIFSSPKHQNQHQSAYRARS